MPSLSLKERIILSRIPKGVWLRVKDIARLTGLKEKQVKYAIRKFKELGIVKIKPDIRDLRKKYYMFKPEKPEIEFVY